MAKQRTALITGAALRVGRALALSLADAGWNIVLHYHRSAAPAKALAVLIARKGRKAHLVQADLRDTTAVARIIPPLARKGIALDCLINNAASFEKDSLAKLTHAQWQAQMNVNLFAPLVLMRDFAAYYNGNEGNVINITDGLEGWSMSCTFLSYALSKHGLTQATRMLACELAPRIRVNAIAPGVTLASKHDTKDIFAKLARMSLLKRTSSPEEICVAMHYLLSSPSVTGQVLSLSAGMNDGA